MKRAIKCFFSFVLTALAFVLISNEKIIGAEYYYETGNVSHTYKDVEVYSFDYDYIVKFNDGEYLVMDNGENIGSNNFYSGSELVVTYNHYDAFLPFVDDNDEVKIYKYSDVREDFSSLFKLFSNEKGTYKLEEEGIYKIVYAFEDSAQYTDYIYIHKGFREMDVSFNGRYNNVSPTFKLTFNLAMGDAYNLVNNEYYYAFGKNDSNLEYVKLNNVFSELESSSVIYNISREITINIDEKINGDNYLYIKCVRTRDNYVMVKSSESVNITNRIQMKVNLVDGSDNILEGVQYYKIGDTLKFKLEFNIEVSVDSSAQYSFDNVNFTSLVNEKGNFKVLYIEKNIDSSFLELTFKKGTYVDYNGNSLPLDIVNGYSLIIDLIAPVVNIEYSQENGQVLRKQSVKAQIKDNYIDKTYFYMKECENIDQGVCLDTFDDSYENVKVSEEDNILIESDTNVRYDGVALTIYIKAIDKAGNEAIVVFYDSSKYIVDNVIYSEGSNPIEFSSVKDGDNVVGKAFFIEDDASKKIKSVKYALENSEDLNSCVLEEGKYICASFSNISFKFDVLVQVEDEYGNVETFDGEYAYFVVNEDKMIGTYNFKFNSVSSSEYEFYAYVYNSIYSQESRVSFDSEKLLNIESLLAIDDNITNKNITLIMIVDDEEYVLSDVQGELIFPTLRDLYELVKNKEEYLTCSISGNVCDLEIYLKYSYNLFQKYNQVRMIKFVMKDNTSKYVVNNFKNFKEISVNGSYEDYEFSYINNLNASVNKDDVEEIVEILYNGALVNEVDTSKLGTYYITRKFSYAQGASFPLSYIVKVVDKEAPTIKLKNEKDYKIKAGNKLESVTKWVEVIDNHDKDVIIKYSFSPELDTSKEGTYVVSIWAEDHSGNVSNVVTRNIVVEKVTKASTYITLAIIVMVPIGVIVVSLILEKKKSKKKISF